jgi:hypothetical protein
MSYFLDKTIGKLCDIPEYHRVIEYDQSPRYKKISISQKLRLDRETPELVRNLQNLHKSFRGKTVHILANGPSLKNFKKVNSEDIVIGINAAGLNFDLDYWMILDNILDDRPLNLFLKKYWKNSSSKHILPKALAYQLMVEDPEYKPFAIYNKAISPVGINELSCGLYWNRSTTHAALDLCRFLNPEQVLIWGLDYEDRSHFYTGQDEIKDDPKDQPGTQWSDFHNHVDGFKLINNEIKKSKIKVLNMNPNSAINIFPKCESIDAIKNNYKTEQNTIILERTIKEIEVDPWENTKLFTFYTIDTDYADLALRCIDSFIMAGNVKVNVIPMFNKKKWMDNILPRISLFYSLSKIYAHKTVVLLDSDLICKLNPTRLLTFTGDVAVHHRPRFQENHQYSAGIVAFKPTEKARNCLKLWAELCEKDADKKIECREQLYLKKALMNDKELRITDLTSQYNNKPEHVSPGDGTVIIHDVASRHTLTSLGGER